MSTDERVSQIEAELKALSQKRKTLISELRSIDKVEKTPSYGTRSNLPFSTLIKLIDDRVKASLIAFNDFIRTNNSLISKLIDTVVGHHLFGL